MTESAYELFNKIKQDYGLSKIGAMGNSLGGMVVGLNAARKDSNLDCICLTSAPSALQDATPILAQALNYFPQSLVRLGTITWDKMQLLAGNSKYANLSHAQFFENGQYKPYAQFGATKIKNIKDALRWVNEAPRLDKVVKDIKQPTLLIYGGDDSLLKIKDGVLPLKIEEMCNNWGSKNNELIIVSHAEHWFDDKDFHHKIDDCFNQDPALQFVKDRIYTHFGNFLQ